MGIRSSKSRVFVRSVAVHYEIATGKIFRPLEQTHGPRAQHLNVTFTLHGRPLGFHLVPSVNTNLEAHLRDAAWDLLSEEIVQHFHDDDLKRPRSSADLDAAAVNPCKRPLLAEPSHDYPFVSVMLATVNNHDVCLETLRHLHNLEYPNFEILLIENTPAPTDLASRIEKELPPMPNLRVLHQPRPGLSAARNLGIAEAKGEIIAFTDDDVVVSSQWLSALVGGFEIDPDIACVTGAIIATEIETPAQSWLEQYGGYCKGHEQERYDLGEHARPDPLYPYNAGRFGSGANSAFRLTALRELGGVSECMGPGTPSYGGEDIDLLFRCVSQGHQLLYEPAAILWHRHREGADSLKQQMYRYGVGLSSALTKWMLENPRIGFGLLSRVPLGLVYLLSPRSEKNASKDRFFPIQLTLLEIGGFLVGPFAHLRSRLHAYRKRVTSP